MKMNLHSNSFSIIIFGCLFCFTSNAQILFTGNIHNATDSLPLPNAAVVNLTAKKVTYTNLKGQFTIEATGGDTLEFSHIGFVTRSFIVDKDNDFVRIFLEKYAYPLSGIDIFGRSHKKDSVENRREFSRAFNWDMPSLNDFILVNPNSVGLSIDAIYQSLRFRHNRLMRNFQATLIRDEQDKFINYKFTPELVTNLTGLKGKELEVFMQKYRPSYYFLQNASEYEFYSYIKAAYSEFLKKQ